MFTVNNLKIVPDVLGFTITADTTDPTKLTFAIPGSVSSIEKDFSSTKQVSVKVSNNTISPISIFLTFENATADLQKFTCTATVRTATFSEPFYTMLKETIEILIRKNKGDVLLGFTYFMNFVKESIRTVDFTTFGITNLTTDQILAFQDQMIYYYAQVSGQRNVDAFISNIYNWFKFMNIDAINPALTLISKEQKAVILQVLDTAINSILWSDLSNSIERLNRKGLIVSDSPLIGVYSGINSGAVLPTATAIDYASLCQNGIGAITSVA